MLNRLTIQNYALINSLDIDFPDGLIIITGETGAGKSILLGALSLLLGAKAGSSIFSDPSRNCVVEGEFDDGRILRRVISPSGRSRSFIDDEPVPLTQLTALSHQLIDIHAQHQHLLLSDPDFQLSVLDCFARNDRLLSDYRKTYRQFKETASDISDLEARYRQSLAELDYITFQYRQLEEARLVDGELEELEKEYACLSNGENIRNAINDSLSLLNPYDRSLSQSLKEISNQLGKVQSFMPALGELSDRIESSRIELDDIESELASLGNQLEYSPERLQFLSDRISSIYSLLKKHNCQQVSELIEKMQDFASQIDGNDDIQEEIEQKKKQLQQTAGRMEQLAGELSRKRKKAAPDLAEELQRSIRDLEMPMARFSIAVSPLEKSGPSGKDSLDFLFSANAGERLDALSKVASGGELSRVMLALKALIAHFTALPTLIFDEIDTGVSGKIADKMGNMIGDMGKNMQVFAITHLPQIACKTGTHYLVYKETTGEHTETHIKKLSGEERILELARMLSGSSLTDAAIENAKVLLKANN